MSIVNITKAVLEMGRGRSILNVLLVSALLFSPQDVFSGLV